MRRAVKPARRVASSIASLALLAVFVPAAHCAPRDDDVQDLLVLGPTRPLLVRLRVTVDGEPFRALWQKHFDEFFAAADRDGDGRITVEQGDTIVRDMNGGLRDTPRSVAKDSLLRSQAREDGTVDRHSLLDYMEKVQPPFMLHNRAVILQGSGLALFPQLDTNHDQQLSEAELQAAQQMAKSRDFNDDGAITGFELLLDPNAIAAAAEPGAEQPVGPQQKRAAYLVQDATTPAEIAQWVLAHYDRDGDGRLSTAGAKHEISFPPEIVNRLDANSDASLDAGEVAALALRSPDLELPVALGDVTTKGRRRRQRVDVEDGWRARQKLDGGYDLRLGDLQIDFKRNNRDPQQADIYSFTNFDTDDNQYVDEQEAVANNSIGREAFKEMDVDGDKKVTQGEFTTFLDGQIAAASVRIQFEVSDKGQDLFEILDIDGDGLLSPRELRTAANVLAVQDTNGDGALNGDEIPLRLSFEIVRGAESPAEEEARAERGRIARSAARANTTGPLWFRKMDRNNDGDLAPNEFVGPLAAFERLDADGDGLIDTSEAEAAGK
jgi:Ca2+-binding EF-hand superfamily protein